VSKRDCSVAFSSIHCYTCAHLHLETFLGINTWEEELWGVLIVGTVEHVGVMFKKLCNLSAPGGTQDDGYGTLKREICLILIVRVVLIFVG